jgi:Flp pilus assembly protein TadG
VNRLRRRLGRLRSDRGTITITYAILLPVLIAIIGLGADNSRHSLAQDHALNVAREAARAGGQVIDASVAIPGGTKEVDVAGAVAAVNDYLATAGVSGVVSVAPDRQHITVTVTITENTVLLQIVGITTFTVQATATAELVVG